jgi:hypothetical protein
MTQISRPWQGTVLGDCGPYSADDWAKVWRNAFGNGSADTDSGPIMGSGIAPDPGLSVTATGPVSASVNISAGAALVHGTFFLNDATVNLAIAANASGITRTDTIVLRKDWTSQTVRLAIIQGAPTAVSLPPPKALTQVDGVTWEIPLADIIVDAGFVSIAQIKIYPRRNWANVSDGVYLNDFLNNSGVDCWVGDQVFLDTTADRAYKKSTTSGERCVGFVAAYTPAGGRGRLLVRGVGYVRTGGATIARGDLILQGDGTAIVPRFAAGGVATTTGRAWITGYALESVTGTAALVLAYIDVGIRRVPANGTAKPDHGADYTTTSATFVDIDGVNLAVSLTQVYNDTILAIFTGTLTVSAGIADLDFAVDGVRVNTAGSDGVGGFTTGVQTITIHALLTVSGGVNGQHNITIQWRSRTGATVRLYAGSGVADADFIPQLTAVEIG